MAGKKINKKPASRQVQRMAGKKMNKKPVNPSRVQRVQTKKKINKKNSNARKLRAKLAEQVDNKASTTAKLDPKKCAIYTRTSSKTNFQGSSTHRQIGEAVKTLAQMTKSTVAAKDIATVSDCISGMLPVHRRQRLVDIITSGQFKAVFVESTRALSRKASVAEDLAIIANQHGVKLIPGDFPSLFNADSPVDCLVRRVMFAVTEFERDMIHKRLMAGLVDKLRKEESKPKAQRNVTQQGDTKVNGRKSHLEKINPSNAVLKQLRVWVKARARGKFGWRVLQTKFEKKLKVALPLETTRRMAVELETKH